jgi:hypothetical protein
MGARRTGRPIHHRVIEIKKNLYRLSSDPIKFKRRQQSPLNTHHIEGRELPINDESFLP